jgi:hypothetical protein
LADLQSDRSPRPTVNAVAPYRKLPDAGRFTAALQTLEIKQKLVAQGLQ